MQISVDDVSSSDDVVVVAMADNVLVSIHVITTGSD